jgi:hypothetical protein
LYPASTAYFNEFDEVEPSFALPGGIGLYVQKYQETLHPGTWVLANRRFRFQGEIVDTEVMAGQIAWVHPNHLWYRVNWLRKIKSTGSESIYEIRQPSEGDTQKKLRKH